MFKEYAVGNSLSGLAKLIGRIEKDFPKVETASEEMLRFKADLLPDIVEGNHTWTIRYKPGVIRWPCNSESSLRNELGVFFPDPDDNNNWVQFGVV